MQLWLLIERNPTINKKQRDFWNRASSVTMETLSITLFSATPVAEIVQGFAEK